MRAVCRITVSRRANIANIANHRFDDFVADANSIHSARVKQFELS